MIPVNGNLTGKKIADNLYEVDVKGEKIEVKSYGLFEKTAGDVGFELEKFSHNIGEPAMGFFDAKAPQDEFYLSYYGEFYFVKIQ